MKNRSCNTSPAPVIIYRPDEALDGQLKKVAVIEHPVQRKKTLREREPEVVLFRYRVYANGAHIGVARDKIEAKELFDVWQQRHLEDAPEASFDIRDMS